MFSISVDTGNWKSAAERCTKPALFSKDWTISKQIIKSHTYVLIMTRHVWHMFLNLIYILFVNGPF